MPIGKRLDDLIKMRKENVNSLSAQIGISPQTVYSIIKRDNMKADLDVLFKLASALDVPIDYFYEPIGQNVASPILHRADVLIKPPHYTELHSRYRAIVDATSMEAYSQQIRDEQAAAPQPGILPDNVISLRSSEQPFSAGRGVYLGPEAFNTICVERNELTEHADYAGPVEGDSMEPKYHDGDILLVSTKEYPERGEIGIFSLDGCGYVKKLGNDKLISLNPKYDPIPMDESIRCNGKVIGTLNPDWIKGDNQ